MAASFSPDRQRVRHVAADKIRVRLCSAGTVPAAYNEGCRLFQYTPPHLPRQFYPSRNRRVKIFSRAEQLCHTSHAFLPQMN